ncbi:GCN5 family acetyltransferase [Pectobacterium betavasculorum]|uniref:GCN5 family acetyltransferase n=1 Tax=Pectobacterium betavasculorum TaxID=55207 RepID=A0A093SRX6_9GAMM|nr:GCN5 family acetyltransferase [Pectobacterium betavasculorum]KFX18282.1 GCN5 family acetyltransferase [Pectobacterium betavasculorum]
MLETERLILRQWRDKDYPVYTRLTSDPEVMRYFPTLLSAEQSIEQAEKLKNKIAEQGWGFWAVEVKESGEFIGFIGLSAVDADSGIPHAPMIEVGWRLLATHWGKGYATEGAKRAIQYAFEDLDAQEIYSFTALVNEPSQRVMIKSGMKNTGEYFEHPKLPPGDKLARHCLYRIKHEEWCNRTAVE